MRALALDVGSRTIGLALSDESGLVASPWEVLRRQGQAADSEEVLRRVVDRGVANLVVGLPLELDGSEGHRARLVHRFLDAFRARLGEREGVELNIVLWDERFSTSAAERSMIDAGASRAKRKQNIDAVAAQFILQGWLDAGHGAPAPEEGAMGGTSI
jgi:putative Holliday junction resolvase